MAGELSRHFSKEEIHTATGYMKRCSTSLIIRVTQIKITMRYHLTSDRIAIIKMARNKKLWKKGNPCALLVGM